VSASTQGRLAVAAMVLGNVQSVWRLVADQGVILDAPGFAGSAVQTIRHKVAIMGNKKTGTDAKRFVALVYDGDDVSIWGYGATRTEADCEAFGNLVAAPDSPFNRRRTTKIYSVEATVGTVTRAEAGEVSGEELLCDPEFQAWLREEKPTFPWVDFAAGRSALRAAFIAGFKRGITMGG